MAEENIGTKEKEKETKNELEKALDAVGEVGLGEAAEKLEEEVVESVGKGLEGIEGAKEKEKKEAKKLDELKETAENKEVVAEAEGKSLSSNSMDKMDSVKEKSKPAVAKTPKVKKYKKKAEVVELEREYIVPMRKGFMNVPHYRRAKKAVKTLKEFMVRHMNVRDGDIRKIKVDINLNNEIWFRGIKNPLHKIKVNAKKIDGIVYVTLAEPADYVKFAMARKERAAAKAEVAGSRKQVAGKAKKIDGDEDKDKNKDGIVDAVEEKEDAKAEAEKDAKSARIETAKVKHTASGKHAQKVAPVRKVLK